MAKGFLWSPEDRYNAEKAARIQAEAIREAQRDAEHRAWRDSLHSRQGLSTYKPEAPAPAPVPVRVEPIRSTPRFERPRPVHDDWEPALVKQAKRRAERVKELEVGTPEYIKQRYASMPDNYGHSWYTVFKGIKAAYECTDDEAWTILLDGYNEEDWRMYESDMIERALGNR